MPNEKSSLTSGENGWKSTDRLLSELEGALKIHERLRRESQDEINECTETETQLIQAQDILQSIAKLVQQSAHEHFATLVSKCLTTVFEYDYDFRIVFEKKRGKTEASFVLMCNDVEIDPLSACGGGVVDVISFALRLAFLLLSKPSPRRLIVLDEPFKFVSAEYLPNVQTLITSLADEMDVQFIIVTHIQELQIGKVIEL